MVPDSISSITRSAVRFFSGTMLSRITGMVRDMVLAFCFGTHEALAALFVAYRLSQLARRLFGEGALQSAFIPVFEEMRSEETNKAFRFFRDLSVLLTLFLVGFIAVGGCALFASHSVVDWSAGNSQIVNLAILILPSLLFICLFGLNSSLLQCQKHYFIVGIAPTFFNISIAVGSLFFHGWDPNAAMPYVAIFIVVGCFLQWGATFVPTMKTLRAHLGKDIWKNIQIYSKDIRRLAAPLALGLLGVGATQINNAIDVLFARYADPEGPAQLWFSQRLLQLPLALFGIAISGALLPPLARSIQAGRKDEYLRFLDFAQRRVFALLLPCTLALFVLGLPLINCIFHRGDFQLHSILMTTECLHTYAIGLIPMGLIIVLGPAFYAFKDFKTPAKGAFLSLIINFVVNCIFIFGFGFKALSVALATSISSWINIIYLYTRLKKHYEQIVSPEGIVEMQKVTLISVLCSALAFMLQVYLFATPQLFNFFAATDSSLPSSLFDQVLYLAIPGFFFLATLFVAAWLFRAKDLLVLFRIRRDGKEQTV